MFFSYNSKLYFGAEDGESYPVTKRRNRLIISSTSAPEGVEGVDRVYDIQELRLKMGVLEILSEKEELALEAKASEGKRKVGKPATKSKKVKEPIDETKEEDAPEVIEAVESEEVEAE